MTLAQGLVGGRLLDVIRLVFRLLQILGLARVIISWIRVDRYNPVVRFIYDTTEPMLRPFRSIARAEAGGFDLSPLILLLVLWFSAMLAWLPGMLRPLEILTGLDLRLDLIRASAVPPIYALSPVVVLGVTVAVTTWIVANAGLVRRREA